MRAGVWVIAVAVLAADTAAASCKTPDWSHWDFSKPLSARYVDAFDAYLDATPIFIRARVTSATRTRDNLWAFDDEAPFAKAMATRLTREGCECRVAGSVAVARQNLTPSADWHFDRALLDWALATIDRAGSGRAVQRPLRWLLGRDPGLDALLEAKEEFEADALRAELERVRATI